MLLQAVFSLFPCLRHNRKNPCPALPVAFSPRLSHNPCYLSLFIYRYLEHKLDDKYTVHEIVTKLQEMKMLEHKGKGFEPIQTRNDLTDDLHSFLGIKTDTEILTYKKIKKIFE